MLWQRRGGAVGAGAVHSGGGGGGGPPGGQQGSQDEEIDLETYKAVIPRRVERAARLLGLAA